MLNQSLPDLANVAECVKVKHLGVQQYAPVLQKLRDFTHSRTAAAMDELWVLQHEPVYTLGQASKPEHILQRNAIPIVQSDRGGQVTYHAPGQLMVYFLVDIVRKKISVRNFICCLENSVIELLALYNIVAVGNRLAPGVYVEQAKICALGLRVRRGCTYHGLSLNVTMDLAGFAAINPCGYPGMQVVRMCDFAPEVKLPLVAEQLLAILRKNIGYSGYTT